MSTTSYFTQVLSATDSNSNAAPGKIGCELEIQISSYSGTHKLYIKHIDEKGKESYSLVNKEQAKELLEGLSGAMRYLGYCK